MCSDMAPVDTTTQWREDWSSASVVNHSIVTDHTIWQPGFYLPRHTWSLLNRFWTGQGPCHANLHIWGLAQSPSCDCGQRQTLNHIDDTCPLTKFKGGLKLLHETDDDTHYITGIDSTRKKKKNHCFALLMMTVIPDIIVHLNQNQPRLPPNKYYTQQQLLPR